MTTRAPAVTMATGAPALSMTTPTPGVAMTTRAPGVAMTTETPSHLEAAQNEWAKVTTIQPGKIGTTSMTF